MQEEKKKKVLAIIFPLAIISLICVVFWSDIFPPDPHSTNEKENVELSYEIENQENKNKHRLSKLDLYRQKHEERKKALSKQNRSTISNDDFYALEHDDDEIFTPEMDDDELFEKELIPPSKRKQQFIEAAPVVKQTTTIQKIVYVKQKVIPKPSQTVATPKRRRSSNNKGGLVENSTGGNKDHTHILAWIDNDNKAIESGDPVQLIVDQTCLVNGFTIPANTRLTGISSFNGDRVFIEIESMLLKGQYIDISLNAFEPDGTKGIKIRGGTNQEIKDDVGNELLDQGTGFTVNIPVVGSISSGSLKKKHNEPSVVLLDKHKIILM